MDDLTNLGLLQWRGSRKTARSFERAQMGKLVLKLQWRGSRKTARSGNPRLYSRDGADVLQWRGSRKTARSLIRALARRRRRCCNGGAVVRLPVRGDGSGRSGYAAGAATEGQS